MKRAIITGTKGFIGKNLLEEIKNDFQVFEINEDIFDTDNWVDVLNGILDDVNPDVIFHVGACSDTLEQDANYMMTRNYEFTKILSEYTLSNECKLIYSSSAASYGTNNLYPSNLYGWSKYVAEQFVLQNGGIALRYFNVYGPGEEHKGRMSSVALQMINKVKQGEFVRLFPGKPRRDFIYIKDVVSANIFAYENYSDLSYSYYDVGYGEARSFEDVLNILNIPFTYFDEKDVPKGYQYFTQCDKKKWLTGWTPKYNLETGLNEYLNKLNNA